MATHPPTDTRPEIATPARGNVPEPRLPHERDESSDAMQPGNEDAARVGEQALRDLDGGLQDTSLGPVMRQMDAAHFDSREKRGADVQPVPRGAEPHVAQGQTPSADVESDAASTGQPSVDER